MDKKYLESLIASREELQRLKEEFSRYVDPHDQFMTTIEQLLEHTDQLLGTDKVFPGSITPEMLEADVAYFKFNVEGLKKVLNALRNRSAKA